MNTLRHLLSQREDCRDLPRSLILLDRRIASVLVSGRDPTFEELTMSQVKLCECAACVQRKMDDLADEHEADALEARRRQPREATDSQWWDWILGRESLPSKGGSA